MADEDRPFELVAAGCTRPLSTEVRARIAAAAEGVDWRRVVAVARRHRVEGLLVQGLGEAGVPIPGEAGQPLKAAAADIARASLAYAGETIRIQRAMETEGIACVALKGSALELLAYGRLGFKSTKDIDLLVSVESAGRAIEVARAAGYEVTHPPGFSSRQMADWIALGRDCEMHHVGHGLQIELHWRLVDSRFLIPAIGMSSPTQRVAVTPGSAITTLGPQALFSYACVHGATHGWSRLKWLCDLNALLAPLDEQALEGLYRGAVRDGAGLCPAQVLLLCERLFGLRLPPALETELHRNRRARWLARVGLRTLRSGGGETELEDSPLGTSEITLSQFVLPGKLSHILPEIAYKWTRGPDLELFVSLPPDRRWLFTAARIRRWLSRRYRGVRAPPTSAPSDS